MGVVGLPREFRIKALEVFARDRGKLGLLLAFADFIGLANQVVDNSRNMVELILMIEGGMSDREAERANLPTMFGALSGIKLAIDPPLPEMCHGCAYRQGSAANQSPSTSCDADWCANPGEPKFLCHAELNDNLEPYKTCAGFLHKRKEAMKQVCCCSRCNDTGWVRADLASKDLRPCPDCRPSVAERKPRAR
jgi:hypothetical protein